jgi:hypothetical protein
MYRKPHQQPSRDGNRLTWRNDRAVMVAFDHPGLAIQIEMPTQGGECQAQLSGGRAATSSARPGSFLKAGEAGRGEGKFTCCKHSRKKTRVNSTGAQIARGSQNTHSRLIRIMTGCGTKSRAPKLNMPSVSKKADRQLLRVEAIYIVSALHR